MPTPRPILALALVASLLACGSDGPTPPPPSTADCDGATTTVRALQPLRAAIVAGDQVRCVALAGAGASYLVAVQLAGADLPYGGYGYRVGDPDGEVAQSALASVAVDGPPDAQHALDAALRALEPGLARRGAASRRPRLLAAPSAGDLRRFSVLSRLTGPLAWAPVDARLAWAGEHVLVWIDTVAASQLTAADLAALGATVDRDLYDVATTTFGAPSDIDGDGRVSVLLTPVVNALVPASECATTGYVRGFFIAHDLASDAATSNRGEVFYAMVPDPAGRWSCAHDVATTRADIPPTFVHELQHMISFGQHVVLRGGAPEEPWLNEGLSHLAEELASLRYEARYPAPSGRTSATQLFPDSATAFITPNLRYANRYLFQSPQYSITSCAPGSFCTLPERGATWLFLRWLGDQKGAAVYRELVATALAGRANVESAAGEPLPALLGDFALATWADSIAGVPRDAVAPRHRFLSRNFRVLHQALFEAYGPTGGVGRPFPIAPVRLEPGAALTGTMRAGTFAMYRVDVPRDVPVARLRFSLPDGSAFAAAAGAQLAILRLPAP